MNVVRYAKEGRLDQVMAAVETQPTGVGDRDPATGFTALHYAAYTGHHEMATYLLENGANAYAKDNYGRWPVHLAYGTGNVTLIALMERHTFRENRDPDSDPFDFGNVVYLPTPSPRPGR